MTKSKKLAFVYFDPCEEPELFAREVALQEALELVARERSRLLNFKRDQFDTHAIPEALGCLLEAYAEQASITAATGFLEFRGYKVVNERTL
jgi:hypothetical protein